MLRQALGDAFTDAAAYLDSTIRSLLGAGTGPEGSASRAFASSQLLDTTLRAFLRGSSARVGVEELGLLSAAATRVVRVARLLGHAQVLVRLAPIAPSPSGAGLPGLRDRARRPLGWFEELGTAISDSGPAPAAESLPTGAEDSSVVLERAGEGLPPGLAIAWAHRHLKVLAEMEPALAGATLAIGADEPGAAAATEQGLELPTSEGVDRVRDRLVS